MNVLFWLTHHIMLFLLGLQSSVTMSSCSQSCVWQYFDQNRWPAENDNRLGSTAARLSVAGDRRVYSRDGEKVNEREIMARQKRKGSSEGTIKFGSWMGRSEKGDESLSLLNDVCKDVSPFYRLHISLLPLYLHSLFLTLSVVSVALRC